MRLIYGERSFTISANVDTASKKESLSWDTEHPLEVCQCVEEYQRKLLTYPKSQLETLQFEGFGYLKVKGESCYS